jgi:sucrose phosphorylase
MKNQVQLITYTDRLCRGGLKELNSLLIDKLDKVISSVHILPFYYPIDGADAGFDPIDHLNVDPRLGTWEDIKDMSKEIDIMADLIVNHVSGDSTQFKDFSKRGADSPYNGFFLTYSSVFPNGATEKDLMAIYRPRPGLPFTYSTLKNGEKILLWTTFTSKQVDIDVEHPLGQKYLNDILQAFADNGIKMIRLDAAGYAIKKPGTSCFMIPETFDFIDQLSSKANKLRIETLVEIHSHYQTQIEIASKVDWVYDFAIPPLLLHAFSFKTSQYLKKWIEIRPENSVTVLDTHDGIGIVDIGPDAATGRLGLVPDKELDELVEIIHNNSQGESRQATGAAASNLDLYQVNCTYLDALAGDSTSYLLARAVQFFLPGIPQVYYMGLLMGHNDMELLHSTGVGRDINRHYYTPQEVDQALESDSVQLFLRLINLRNQHASFEGVFSMLESDNHSIILKWTNGDSWSELSIDFQSLNHQLQYTNDGIIEEMKF